jgi:hypothetical protein
LILRLKELATAPFFYCGYYSFASFSEAADCVIICFILAVNQLFKNTSVQNKKIMIAEAAKVIPLYLIV